LFSLGPWSVFLQRPVNRHGWARLVIRLTDAQAPKRSFWIAWHTAQGMARDQDAERLAQDHPQFMRDLQLKLRRWQPGS
jgi:hypothetical protein